MNQGNFPSGKGFVTRVGSTGVSQCAQARRRLLYLLPTRAVLASATVLNLLNNSVSLLDTLPMSKVQGQG
jgi:hypothetical protein